MTEDTDIIGTGSSEEKREPKPEKWLWVKRFFASPQPVASPAAEPTPEAITPPPEPETAPAAPQEEPLPASVLEAAAALDPHPTEAPIREAEAPIQVPVPEAVPVPARVPEETAGTDAAPAEAAIPEEEASVEAPLAEAAPVPTPGPEAAVGEDQVPTGPVGPEVVSEESGPASAPEPRPADLQPFRALEDRLSVLQNEMALLQKDTESVLNQQGIMQRSMRQMNVHINEVATTVSAPRIRELYLRLLLLYDLVEPAPAHLTGDAVDFCRLLAGQIEEFLEVNGIKAIATDGLPFEARKHKAVGVALSDAVTPEGIIVETRRKGFHSDNQVLRPADVVIAKGSAVSVAEEKPSANAAPDDPGTDNELGQ